MNPGLHVVILAGGRGRRMGTTTPKVLLPLAGLPMLEWVLRACSSLSPTKTTAVLGYSAENVSVVLGHRDVRVRVREPLLGPLPWVESVHPSPLSARRAFFGSKPFSRVNRLLEEQGAPPVDWTLPTYDDVPPR